jgi:hypothetical protein
VTFLRYFGFAEGIIASLYSEDGEQVQISLHILYFLSSDHIIGSEIITAGGMKSVKEMLFLNDEISRVEALGVFMNLSLLKEAREEITRKDLVVFLIMLEEASLKGSIRSVFLIWRIFQNISIDTGVCIQLVNNGVIRLLTMSLNLFNS